LELSRAAASGTSRPGQAQRRGGDSWAKLSPLPRLGLILRIAGLDEKPAPWYGFDSSSVARHARSALR
jgi:hypothetical protein